MSTAREQAREAATTLVSIQPAFQWPDYPNKCADAASDVWEPLLRTALSTMEESRRRTKRNNFSTSELDFAIQEIKKQLGDATS